MKRRFVRQLLLFGCLLMLVPAVLTACGGDDDDDTGDSGATTTEVSESTPTEETTEEATDEPTDAATDEATEEASATDEATDDESATDEATDEATEDATEDADGTSTAAEGTATESNGTETEGQTGGDMTAKNTWDGPIVFGDFDWTSSLVHNRIAQYIIENGFDYDTEVIQGTTAPIIQGMVGGDVQVTMEIWTDNIQEIWTQALDEGTLVDLGPNYPESSQGWFVPTYMIEGDEERGIEPMAPDLKSVEDLPDYKELFKDEAQPDKGRFYNGVTGWQITQINSLKLQSYGLDDDYTDFLPGSSAALFASLTDAYKNGDPWLGYLWSPHWVFAQMDMTMLEQPEFTEECWSALTTAVDEGSGAPEEACAAPSVEVHVGANADFAEQAPGIIAFLQNYQTTEEQTNNFLLWMNDNEATEEETAIHFLNEHPDIWTTWVTDEIAAKVQDALDNGVGIGGS